MFAKRIKELREENNISQKEFAKTIGVAQSTYALYETDKREPSFDVLIKIAQYFNVTTDFLLGLVDERTIENVDIAKNTGLSDEAIKVLNLYVRLNARDNTRDGNNINILINMLLEDFCIVQNINPEENRYQYLVKESALLNLILNFLNEDTDGQFVCFEPKGTIKISDGKFENIAILSKIVDLGDLTIEHHITKIQESLLKFKEYSKKYCKSTGNERKNEATSKFGHYAKEFFQIKGDTNVTE